jgi:two-component system alkaline phosphatase synthesis response regulator PhoP
MSLFTLIRSTMNEYRILVVDDEEDLCEILKFNLENEGYEVDTANSAEEALKMDISTYDLLLLDVMMGEISGFKMASMLKKEKKTAKVPIIFITAKDTENDTVTGFNLGADDYISKPFSLREVAARVKAVLRRTQQAETERAGTNRLQIISARHHKKESKHRWRGSASYQERV